MNAPLAVGAVLAAAAFAAISGLVAIGLCHVLAWAAGCGWDPQLVVGVGCMGALFGGAACTGLAVHLAEVRR